MITLHLSEVEALQLISGIATLQQVAEDNKEPEAAAWNALLIRLNWLVNGKDGEEESDGGEEEG